VCARGSKPAALGPRDELCSIHRRPVLLGAPSTHPLGAMGILRSRILLIASYCVMAITMAIEVVSHPQAKDHVASITGLGFCVVTLVALVWNRSARLNHAVAALNVFIAMVGAYIIARYLFSYGLRWTDARGLLSRLYFVVLVPVAVVWYFIACARGANVRAHGS
jgi:hypothetical protein